MSATTGRHVRGWLLISSAIVLAGCNGRGDRIVGNGHDRLAAPLGTISVYQLAGRLNLTVTENSGTLAILRNAANVVIVYADPNGQAYVNARPVGQTGGITPIGDMLFVPEPLSRTIRPAMRRSPQRRRRPEPPRPSPVEPVLGRVVLDAGHGGKDPGAISATGLHEKAVVLDTVLLAAEGLRSSGVEVNLTRSTDRFVPLNERAEFANRLRAALFVSVHADAAPNRSARGFTVYVAQAASHDSLALARAIERRLSGQGVFSRGIRRANYRVLVRTSCPAVLVELGFLSNAAEAARLAQSTHRRRLAEAVCAGVLDYLRSR